MKNIFENKCSEEQQWRLISIITTKVRKALIEYQKSPKYTFDSIKNRNDIEARKIALKIVNDTAKKVAHSQNKTTDEQKVIINHYKTFVKRHTRCISNRYDWKKIREAQE